MIEQCSSTGFGLTPETFFRNAESGEEYCRIIGGFAWPSINPGFFVVVAEERKINYIDDANLCCVTIFQITR